MNRTKNLEYFISSFVLRATFYELSSSQEMKKNPTSTRDKRVARGVGLDIEGREQTGGNLTYCYVLI